MSDRDKMGRLVREAWIAWARKQPSPKPSWLVPYEQLHEADQEADRQIGEAVSRCSTTTSVEPAEKKPVEATGLPGR